MEIFPLFLHGRKDIVTSPVQYGEEGTVPVTRQPLFQSSDDRDPSSHAGLKADIDPVLLGLGKDLFPVNGQESLVGGHDILARLHSLQNVAAGRFVASDQFDNDVDIGIAQDLFRAMSDKTSGKLETLPPIPVPDQDLL